MLSAEILRRPPLLKQPGEQHFDLHGLDLFAGAAFDTERFAWVDVKKNDLFAGASLKGFGRFDFTEGIRLKAITSIELTLPCSTESSTKKGKRGYPEKRFLASIRPSCT